MKNITIFGAGYVGIVSGVCFSEFGNHVTLVDVDVSRIEMLRSGRSPIYEYGLEPYLQRNIAAGRLGFSTDVRQGVLSSEMLFIAVGTPSTTEGFADVEAICELAAMIGRHMDGYRLVVDKSTVPVGTARRVAAIIREELGKRGAHYDFDIASNPEFLREGRAMEDFMKPQRVLVGAQTDRAKAALTEAYRPLVYKDVPFVFTDTNTAEMAKYASNAFLAVKVTFINEMAILCERMGANVQQVAEAMGIDTRIGSEYLKAGPGFGGSCFPKDIRALAGMGRAASVPMRLAEAAIEANEAQKRHMVEKIEARMGDLIGKRIAVLGLTFKPETDDMREAPALHIVGALYEKGAVVSAFDPHGMTNAKEMFSPAGVEIEYSSDPYEAVAGADAVVLLTEWEQFEKLDLKSVRHKMQGRNFFDFRNVFDRKQMEGLGFEYEGVGV
ncbi:MAG: UDP-glucose/GDP-mannose dehydrogenase family protein [Clostridiales bacterium]|jgi:UDPglucose 6-dehydrogenase|nr:UDP-glucose/GDP-mannose dehydrogenase family protein [Clostridiales bacterium]